MKTKSVFTVILVAFIVSMFTKCSDMPEAWEDAVLTIDYDRSVPAELKPALYYKIDVYGSTTASLTVQSGEPAKVKVNIGNYAVFVTAYYSSNNTKFADGTEIIDVKAGQQYTVNIRLEVSGGVKTPTATVPTGTYTNPLSIKLECETDGVTFRYTLDGNDPTSTSTLYNTSNPISISTLGKTTLKVIAYKTGLKDSMMFTAEYTMNAAWTAVVNSESNTTAIIFEFTLPVPAGYLTNSAISIQGSGTVAGTFNKSASEPSRSSDGKTWTLSGTTAKSGSVQVNINKTDISAVNHILTLYLPFPVWTQAADIIFGGIRDITYGGGKFVAVGYNQISYSTDAVTWTTVTRSDTFISVAYGNSMFVAGSDNGAIVYSPDGMIWTQVADSTFGSDSISGIIYGNGKFVAVGNNGRMAYSINGITWTAVSNSSFASNFIRDITWGGTSGNEKFVAVGDNGRMGYSTGGDINWIQVTSSFGSTSSGNIYGITYGGGKFVAVGICGKIAHSTDGINWTQVVDSTFGSTHADGIYGVTYGGSKFVAVGSSSKIAYSTDGIAWTRVADSPLGGMLEIIYGIAYGGGRFVAGGSDGKIAYSPAP